MKPSVFWRGAAALLSVLAGLPRGEASNLLGVRIEPHQTQCFYTYVDQVSRKVTFYFAVRAGGAFDVDYRVLDANRHVIFNGVREKQGDFFFTAKHAGEYSFCFSNNMSSVTDKVVDFQISVENEPRAMLPEHEEKVHNPTGALDEFLYKISNSFAVIRNSQKSLRLRESRNLSTVRSTETRIVWFSLVESFLILVVSLLQVFVLKTFFTKTSFRV